MSCFPSLSQSSSFSGYSYMVFARKNFSQALGFMLSEKTDFHQMSHALLHNWQVQYFCLRRLTLKPAFTLRIEC